MNFLNYVCAVTMLEAMVRLAEDDTTPFAEYPGLEKLIAQLDSETVAFWESNNADPIKDRMQLINARMNGDEVAQAAVSLAVTVLLYPDFEVLLKKYAGDSVTLSLAFRLVRGFDVQEDFAAAQEAFNRLERFLLCDKRREPFLHAPISADARLLSFICGDDHVDELLYNVAYFGDSELQPLYAGEKDVEKVLHALAALDGGSNPLLHITGQPGCGKRLLLQHAADAIGKKFLFVDCALLFANPLETLWRMIDSIRREALFYGAGVCYYHANADMAPTDGAAHNGDMSRFIHLCVRPLWAAGIFVAACSEPDVHLMPYIPGTGQKVELSPFTRVERIAVWKGYCEQYGVQLDEIHYGSKYIFSPLETKKVIRNIQVAAATGKPDDELISAICMQILPPPTGSIRHIQTRVTLDDLKLPEVQKKKLLSICDHVIYRHRVYDDWNMESVFAYGRNVSALFVGPPGTGKTMAAHVISTMLNLPLYRIDLSQVIDKYIGETEKRLEEIFLTAEKNNPILFFDEADAIFGKRSDVNDAKDRYANTDVSYILQRIEEYDGIVLLATNFKKNIDEAFMRRMRYVVEFNLPNEALRREIWACSFAKEVPTAGIDFDYLARQFELSGGAIKNIVLNATFAAAASNGPVEMTHILEGIRNENIKLGKSMLKQDFAEYGAMA